MSRKRNISTDISRDKRVARLQKHGMLPMLLYTWAIPHADDWGRLPGDPFEFKFLVCPALNCADEDIQAAIEAIAAEGLWQLYTNNDVQCIAFPYEAWFKHQSYVNANKRQDDRRSAFPAPPDWPISSSKEQATPTNTNERQQTPTNGNEQQETPQNAASPTPTPTPTPTPSPTPSTYNSACARDDIPPDEFGSEEDAAHQRRNPVMAQAVAAYQDKINPTPTLSEFDMLAYWSEKVDLDVILYAINQTEGERDKQNHKYINGILMDKHDKGIVTKTALDKLLEEQSAKKQQREASRKQSEEYCEKPLQSLWGGVPRGMPKPRKGG